MDASMIAEAIRTARTLGTCLDAGQYRVADDQAYAIQDLMTQARLDCGESVIGWKLGYTSTVMREQMGILQPNFGPLTDAMILPDGGVLPPAMQPKAEPEIALVMGADGVAEARLAIEIVDSVWCDYRFTWAQNTADGSSAAYVVLGPALPLDGLPGASVELLRNGELAGTGTGDAAMGDPLLALAWLVGELTARRRGLRSGDVIITGGLCAAVPFLPGDVIAARSGADAVSVSRQSPGHA